MITGLKENENVKADQYWPNVKEEMPLDNQVSVKLEKDNELLVAEGITERKFTVKPKG